MSLEIDPISMYVTEKKEFILKFSETGHNTNYDKLWIKSSPKHQNY